MEIVVKPDARPTVDALLEDLARRVTAKPGRLHRISAVSGVSYTWVILFANGTKRDVLTTVLKKLEQGLAIIEAEDAVALLKKGASPKGQPR